MDKNHKIIFVDIDWTILDHHKHDWDYESIDVLKQAQNSGVLVYLNTSRPYDSIVHTGLFDVFTPNGIICTNGGVIFVGDKLIHSNVIPEPIVAKIERICSKYGLVLELATNTERYFTAEPNEYVDNYFKVFAETIPPVKKYHNKDVSAILLFAPEKYDEKLQKMFPKETDYIRFDDHGVDVGYCRNNKGDAVVRVLTYLGIKKEEAIGAGDDLQDIDMFNEVGLSIALGNAKEEVKNSADIIAKDISEHGVEEALKEILF